MIVFKTSYYGQVTGKKNNKVISINQRTGRPFVRMNDRAKVQELSMINSFAHDLEYSDFTSEDFLDKRIEVLIEVWNQDKRKHDLDNQLSTVLDALVKARVLPDDSQETIWCEKAAYMGVDKDDPRVLVTIKAD